MGGGIKSNVSAISFNIRFFGEDAELLPDNKASLS